MKRILAAALIALFVLYLIPPGKTRAQIPAAQMARGPYFYVTAKGVKQGQFKGEILPFNPATKDHIPGIRFSMQEASPRDAASGLPSGKRQYTPITFTKLWGPSSPEFLTALANNETLTEVTFTFTSVGMDARPIVTESIKLTNANVASIRRYINVATGIEPADPRQLEDISVTFQKIELTDQLAGTMFADDWSARM